MKRRSLFWKRSDWWLLEAYKRGWTREQIASLLGVSVYAVGGRLRRLREKQHVDARANSRRTVSVSAGKRVATAQPDREQRLDGHTIH